MDLNVATHREVTRAYIQQDPSTISLVPRVKEITPGGGVKFTDGPARTAQTFKLIPMTFDQRPTVTVDGVERIIDYTLLGNWDAVIEPGDHWVAEGHRYEVVAIADGHDWSTKGLVERHLYEA